MKTLAFFLTLFLFLEAKSQTITGITPNQGTVGTTLTAIITGNNTFFMTASSQHTLNIDLFLPDHCRSIAGTHINTFAQDSLSVDFVIPAGFLNGDYKLNIHTLTYDIAMSSAVTITGGNDFSLQSITPSAASENSVFSATVTGLNLQSLLGQPGASLYLYRNPNFRYTATNINVINPNTITADFIFPTYCDTGNMKLEISSNSVGCFFVLNAVYVQGIYPKNLLSINPPQGNAGNSLTAVVTGQNTLFMSGSTQGFQYIQLRDQHCHVISGTNPVVTDDDHFNVNFNIPSNAVNGIYDLNVRTLANYSYSLPASFTISGGMDRDVLSFSPSTANAGTTLTATITGHSLDSLLSGTYSVMLMGPGGFHIVATNITSTSLQATMDFVIPPYANNGFYSLSIISQRDCYSINQALEIFGGAYRGLVSITPSTGLRGQTLSAVVTGAYTFFMLGCPQGNINRFEFKNVNNGQQFNVVPPNIVLTDSAHASITLGIPYWAQAGFYDVRVVLVDGSSYILHPGFEVTGMVISGNVYFDVDSSGTYNINDTYMPGKKVLLLPDSAISFTDWNGQFNFGVDSGQYTVQYYPDTEWVVTSSPPVYSLAIDSLDTLGLKFGLQPVNESYELYTTIVGGQPRCNRDVYYDISYLNFSTNYVAGVIGFIPDSNLIVNSSVPPADFTNGDTLFWNYDSLAVAGNGAIRLTVHMPGTAGMHIQSYTFISANDGLGNILASASDTLPQIVTCSFDPNDKSVEPAGVQAEHYTLNNNYLEYLVRFQNTGNDTAFQVIILDTLDFDLDPLSLQVIASSHLVETHLYENVVEFRFDNILLPDSNVNEPLSHGYVKFRILPRNLSADNVEIHNTANIYFDMNHPVITNNVFNTLVNQIPDGIVIISRESGGILIYPNPSNDKIKILFKNPSSQKVVANFYNVNGALVKNCNSNSEILEVDIHNWDAGFYFVSIESSDGKIRLNGKLLVSH